MVAIREQGCAILKNLNEGVISRSEERDQVINYCNDSAGQMFKNIPINKEQIRGGNVEEINQYLKDKKEFIINANTRLDSKS